MTRPAQPRAILIVTDLDGTLLDHTTYEFAPAQEALDALRSRGARLVLATSKTAPEVAVLAAQLAWPVAAIVENGGAIVAPPGFWPAGATQPVELPLGVARDALVPALAAIAAEAGTTVRGFAHLTVSDVAALTGLVPEQARLAVERRYDEPFLLDDESRLPAVVDAAAARGLVVTTGGRFHHLTGPTDKGRALQVLLERLAAYEAAPATIGLGDAPNDLSFLLLVDRPVIVPRPSGRHDDTLVTALPAARRAPLPGPAGWNLAVLEELACADT